MARALQRLKQRAKGAGVPIVYDYFVLKPKHSGFYESSLGVLLDHLGVD
jgi:hypothetical protein